MDHSSYTANHGGDASATSTQWLPVTIRSSGTPAPRPIERRPPPEVRTPNRFFYGIVRIWEIIAFTAVFGFLAGLSWIRGILSNKEPDAVQEALASQFTEYLQRMGGTFIKLGQFLSARSDFVPPVYCEQLSRLFDDAKPFPNEEAIALLIEELGPDVMDSFPELPRHPSDRFTR
jgi:predicted unusual protein kinase regulating ubiquinone biosynthesis (AarF/ABC1/UbiB family)